MSFLASSRCEGDDREGPFCTCGPPLHQAQSSPAYSGQEGLLGCWAAAPHPAIQWYYPSVNALSQVWLSYRLQATVSSSPGVENMASGSSGFQRGTPASYLDNICSNALNHFLAAGLMRFQTLLAPPSLGGKQLKGELLSSPLASLWGI